eukprot:7010454-Prymnesium_polylepis.2
MGEARSEGRARPAPVGSQEIGTVGAKGSCRRRGALPARADAGVDRRRAPAAEVDRTARVRAKVAHDRAVALRCVTTSHIGRHGRSRRAARGLRRARETRSAAHAQPGALVRRPLARRLTAPRGRGGGAGAHRALACGVAVARRLLPGTRASGLGGRSSRMRSGR